MFNLFRSQRKTVRILLTTILSVVALSMVVTFIPGVFDSPEADLFNPVLVEVGDAEVTIRDVEMQLMEYRRAGSPPDALAYMAEQIVDNVTLDSVLLQEASVLGVRPTEAELAMWLRDQMPFLFDATGKFVGSQQYGAMVQQRFQKSIPEFEKDLLKDLTIEMRLRELVTDSITMSEEEVKELYRARNEQTQVEWAAIDAASLKSRVTANDEQLAQYFEQNKFRYRVQEKRVVQAIRLAAADVAPPEFAEARLRNFYDQNRYRFETPERVKMRHILFGTADKSEEEIKEIEVKANEVLEKVKAGEDFEALAKEHSEDPGSAPNGGDLGLRTRGEMVPEFDDAAFALKAGETTQSLVKTQFGLHIIRADERQSGSTRTFDEVRGDIVADLTAEHMQEEKLAQVDRAVAAVQNLNGDIAKVGDDLGVPVLSYPAFTRTGGSPELSQYPELFGRIFSSRVGEPLTHQEESGTTLLATVTEIQPARDAAYDEVNEQVREDYIIAEARKLAEEQAKKVLAEAREANGDLSRVAAKYGLKMTTSPFFKRTDEIENFSSAQQLGDAAFTAEPGTVEGPVRMGDRIGVYRVVAHQEPDMTEYFDQRRDLRQQYLIGKQDEAWGLYRAMTRKQWDDSGKIIRHDARIAEYLRLLRSNAG